MLYPNYSNDHGEVRTRQSPLKSHARKYNKMFQYLQDKAVYSHGLLRCGRRLGYYLGMEGSLEDLNLLNVCCCGGQFVPVAVLYSPQKNLHFGHCNIGLHDEKPL